MPRVARIAPGGIIHHALYRGVGKTKIKQGQPPIFEKIKQGQPLIFGH